MSAMIEISFTDHILFSFVVWYSRNAYLTNIKDGVGERLISLNTSVLNTPGFRAAGWAPTSSEIKRTYSPPIPTALTSEYFQVPRQGRQTPASFDDNDEEGGLVTGVGSGDTIGPRPIPRRRRRKEHAEDEDSSDLSDESEDEFEGAQRAAQQIKFSKMPLRNRSESLSVRDEDSQEAPEVNVISPSRRSTDGRLRRGSLGAVESVKARARANTATSSDLSSDNDFDPSLFQRREIGNHKRSAASNTSFDVPEELGARPAADQEDLMEDDSGEGSVDSELDSEFGETVETASLLENEGGVAGLPDSSPVLTSANALSTANVHSTSPKRTRTAPSLQPLPPPRPISVVPPVSLLGAALRARKATPANPLERFQGLSGEGTPNPLYIKIYAPFSKEPEEPFEILLGRQNKEGNNITVAEAIGFALWRYQEEEIQPSLEFVDLNVNKWVLRMVEDGEVEYDFPPLGRGRPMLDFTNNNLRAARGRSRERPWDEFALVKADARQEIENNKLTPQFAIETREEELEQVKAPEVPVPTMAAPTPAVRTNAGLGQPFPSALNFSSLTPADQPAPSMSYATPRVGVTKTLKIRYMDLEMSTQSTTMDIATDNYIADILDHVCKRWNLDKAGFLLKVAGTNTVAPLDRTVEALGNWSDLEVVRRRFLGGPYSLTGSPGSSSPNAPLLIDIDGPKKGKKNTPLANLMSSTGGYKRYVVIRKQPMSFTQANQRVLTFDGDYIHIMPAETTKTLYNTTGKSTSILFSNVLSSKVSRKHPKSFKLVVRRGNGEQKRYDFEAKHAAEAIEIVEEIRKFMTNAA